MPDAANEKDQENIEIGAQRPLPAAAQREIDIGAEEPGQRDVPALPKIINRERLVG